jgi:O-antigen/teichoic acid export membrane protein
LLQGPKMIDTTAALGRCKIQLTRVKRLLEQPLVANAGYLLGVNVVSGVAGFAFWGLVARLHAPEAVGTASAIVSAAMLLSGLADLGTSSGLIRFLAESLAPKRLLNTVFTFNVIMALLLAGGYLAGLAYWSPSLAMLRKSTLYVVGFLAFVITTALGTVIRMGFVARRQANYALIQTFVTSSGRILLLFVLSGLGLVGLVSSVTLSMVVAVVFSLFLLLPRVEVGYRPQPALDTADLRHILPYSLGNYVASLLAQNVQVVLPLLTLEVLGPATSGYTYIAWMLGGLLSGPGLALAGSAFAEGSNAPERLIAILARATRLGMAVTVPAAVLLGALAPWVLLMFGPEYADGGTELMRWLAAAAVPVVLARLYLTYLRVRKQIGVLILLSGLIVATTLGVAAALMPHYGVAASGMGWLLGNSIVVLVALGSARKHIRK